MYKFTVFSFHREPFCSKLWTLTTLICLSERGLQYFMLVSCMEPHRYFVVIFSPSEFWFGPNTITIFRWDSFEISSAQFRGISVVKDKMDTVVYVMVDTIIVILSFGQFYPFWNKTADLSYIAINVFTCFTSVISFGRCTYALHWAIDMHFLSYLVVLLL